MSVLHQNSNKKRQFEGKLIPNINCNITIIVTALHYRCPLVGHYYGCVKFKFKMLINNNCLFIFLRFYGFSMNYLSS